MLKIKYISKVVEMFNYFTNVLLIKSYLIFKLRGVTVE